MIRSPSGDIDIITLFVCHDFSDTQILIDNGSGKNRKIVDVTSSGLSPDQRRALLGMHAFSGNDYVSSFFRKGKLAVWKTVTKNNAFVELFSSLGTEVTVSEELVRRLEWFVCSLYGYPRIQSVNEARRKVFWDRFHKENKIIDLSLMPPCSSNLRYHIMRANTSHTFSDTLVSYKWILKALTDMDGTQMEMLSGVTSVTPRRLMRYLQQRIMRIVLAPMIKNTRKIWMWKLKMLVNFKKVE